VTEVLFYQLRGQAPEAVLPALVEKALERGYRIVVQAGSEERVAALDEHLWTFREDSFVPHGTDRESDAATQPIVLTMQAHNPNAANLRLLIDGASLPADSADYARLVVMFDGGDAEALAAAREDFAAARGRGHSVTWWEQDGDGRWQRQDR
jgi:DNA polymerase-3 subunit chi